MVESKRPTETVLSKDNGSFLNQPVQGKVFVDPEPYISSDKLTNSFLGFSENNHLKSFLADKERASNVDKIKVVVRKRPLNKKEIARREEDIITIDPNTNSLTVHETELKVYSETLEPIVPIIFQQTKATCFAYGQTGSGKTYTTQPLPLMASEDIFRLMHQSYRTRGFQLYVSFFEIYGGKVFDLLNDRNKLCMREDGKQQVCIVGLQEYRVSHVETVKELIERGNATRSTGTTGANEESFRSHAILQLAINRLVDDNESKPARIVGKLSFIDLAGIERGADTTDNDRQKRMEGAEINKSLLALKECIRALDNDQGHIPFRGSKLTEGLRDSFVGDSRSVMITCISPNSGSCEHTIDTLRYADRFKSLSKGNSSRRDPLSSSLNLRSSIVLPLSSGDLTEDDFEYSEETHEQDKPLWMMNKKVETYQALALEDKMLKTATQTKQRNIPEFEINNSQSDDDLNSLLKGSHITIGCMLVEMHPQVAVGDWRWRPPTTPRTVLVSKDHESHTLQIFQPLTGVSSSIHFPWLVGAILRGYSADGWLLFSCGRFVWYYGIVNARVIRLPPLLWDIVLHRGVFSGCPADSGTSTSFVDVTDGIVQVFRYTVDDGWVEFTVQSISLSSDVWGLLLHDERLVWLDSGGLLHIHYGEGLGLYRVAILPFIDDVDEDEDDEHAYHDWYLASLILDGDDIYVLCLGWDLRLYRLLASESEDVCDFDQVFDIGERSIYCVGDRDGCAYGPTGEWERTRIFVAGAFADDRECIMLGMETGSEEVLKYCSQEHCFCTFAWIRLWQD